MFLGGWLGMQIMSFASNIFTHFPIWSAANA
jgi:type III secretion protein S